MSLLAPIAPQQWDVDLHPVTLVLGASSDARSAALDDVARGVLDAGGDVTVISPDRDGLPAGARLVSTIDEALNALFAALDGAADTDKRHLVVVDRIAILIRGAGHARNELDATLPIVMSVAERTGIRVAVSAAGDLSRVVPMTAFALRHASKLSV
ncbi:hypothetical protein [Microbacterium hominis]|uniref:Uncharacterized protein n=1 Tax=Microbacterium hominis TaxID=162426 RepID=A0A2K9DXW9_9MICO|nr:hypothetical protein [Microbacterium hominis]AUG29483.1 hypothetical protein CXR34_08405 [Microbacterium hominis]